MPIYTKVNGAYQDADPFIKVNGAWVPATNAFIKVNGAWQQSFIADSTPPSQPIMTIQNVDNAYIRVRVRQPEGSHQTDIRRIRVKVGATAYPTNPADSQGYFSKPNTAGGVEPWSDFHFNNTLPDGKGGFYTDGRVTTSFQEKWFQPTYKKGDKLRANATYYFAAWAEDMAGNWSAMTYIPHTTGKTASTANENRYISAFIPPIKVGTIDDSTSTFTEGDGYVGNNPNRLAHFRYSNIIENLVGDGDAIIYARILLFRASADHGVPAAKTYAWRHNTSADYVAPAARFEPSWLLNADSSANSINKGGSVWKDLPESWLNNLNDSHKGIILGTNPGDTLNTQAVYLGSAAQSRSGTIFLRIRG